MSLSLYGGVSVFLFLKLQFRLLYVTFYYLYKYILLGNDRKHLGVNHAYIKYIARNFAFSYKFRKQIKCIGFNNYYYIEIQNY